MRKNIHKLILLETILGILCAFLCQRIIHVENALEILYLPFEWIGKGLRYLSLSSMIGNIAAIIIYGFLCMLPTIYVLYRKRKQVWKSEDILFLVITLLLFYILYMFINPGEIYQKMGEIFQTDHNSLRVMKIGYALFLYSILLAWMLLKAIRFLSDDHQKNWKDRLYYGMKLLLSITISYYTIWISYVKIFEILKKMGNRVKEISIDEWIKTLLPILPVCLMILLLIRVINVVRAMQEQSEEDQIIEISSLASTAKVVAVVTIIADLVMNFYQFLASAQLQNVNFTLNLSVEPVMIAFGALIFHEYFKRTKQLKEENDQFI